MCPQLDAAYVRWGCFPGLEGQAEAKLQQLMGRIRGLAFRKYKSWYAAPPTQPKQGGHLSWR